MQNDFIVVDAHEDLAWNMLSFGRDYTQTVAVTRSLEASNDTPTLNGDTLIGWDAYQNGRVAVVFASLFATPIHRKEGDWDKLSYADGDEAYRLYREQVDAYYRLIEQHPEKFTLIQTKDDMLTHIGRWERGDRGDTTPVGLVILMEGAECVREPDELMEWWQTGVRIIGPAWSGTRYCGGTGEPGPLTKEGYRLLDGMAEMGFTLDLSHMDEEAVMQALGHYPGRIIATHANAKALIKDTASNRFLSDRVLQGLLERNGIIGIVPYNRFLNWDWKPGKPRDMVSLDDVIAHIDYVCQMAGDALHVGIGSDADGGFGLQSVPAGMDSIADLQKLVPLLEGKGYSEEDIKAVLAGNWIGLLEDSLPETG